MAKLEYRELTAVRWVLGQLLVLISFVGSYALDVGADLFITVGIVLTGLATIAPSVPERIPGFFWKISPPILLIVIVSDFVLSGGDILPSLFRMVLLLTLYRALQIRTPREDLQLLLLSLFLLILTGVLSQEVTFALQMLLFAPLAMGQLFAVNLSSREPGTEQVDAPVRVFSNFSWPRLLRHFWQRFDPRTLIAGFFLFLLMTGMALMLFIFLPRFDLGASLPFPRLQTKQSLTGFSDHVRYGDVVSILNDNAIAMRVDVEAERPPARPYWRMVVLDAYYDGGFMVSPQVVKERRKMRNFRFEFDDPRDSKDNPVPPSTWTLYLEGGISSYLPTGDSFRDLRFKSRTSLEFFDLTRVYKTIETNANTLSLRYQDLQFGGVLPWGIQDPPLLGMKRLITDTSKPTYLKEVRYPQTLLVFPEGDENVSIMRKVLRSSGFRKGMPVDEFAAQVTAYLQDRHSYSLESSIPPGEADSLLRWVDSDAPGHCELYAGALVLICRYAGYPARMVTGFAGGDWNGFENYYMVRNSHAHAWCEVFDAEKGWLRVDPTPGSGLTVDTVDAAIAAGGLRADRSFQARLDSLRILWFRRVIQFDSTDQEFMAESVKGVGLKGLDWFLDGLKELRNRLKTDFTAAREGGHWAGLLKDYLVPLLVGGLFVLILLLTRRKIRRRNFEQIIRRKASVILRRRDQRGLPEEDGVHREVQSIRYGPIASWPSDPARQLAKLSRQRSS